MSAITEVTIRRARRDDVGLIVAMLADDPLGGGRERIEDPLPQSYFAAFERSTAIRTFSLSSPRTGRAPWSAACSSAFCRG